MQPTGTESAPVDLKSVGSKPEAPSQPVSRPPNATESPQFFLDRSRAIRLLLAAWRGRIAAAVSHLLMQHANTNLPAEVVVRSAEECPFAERNATMADDGCGWRINGASCLAAVGLAALFIWSYWPVLVELWQAWGREADYSHGYLVFPVAVAFLWLRRGSCPAPRGGLSLGGLALFAASALVRLAGALWYVEALQGWSILLWLAGACWLLGGFARLRFCAAAIGFLAFMIPLPFRAEGLLSLPLQRVATQLSCWMLQCLGQPAIAEGNIVVINDTRLMVAEACSGLRIFISILAMAYAFCVLLERPKWIKIGLLLSVLPVTLVTNSLRIVATGLVRQYVSGEAAHVFAHDLAGWLMLPVAGLLMYGAVLYFAAVVVEVETVSARELFRPGEPA